MMNRTIIAVLFALTSANAEEISEPQLISTSSGFDMDHKVMNLYLKFVAEFGKQYASKDHMDERFEIFRENYEKMEAHNTSTDDEGRLPSFEMGIN